MGCWTPAQDFAIGADSGPAWRAELTREDGSAFSVRSADGDTVEVSWSYCGRHNVENAIAAMAAARHVGVLPAQAAQSLSGFKGVKRRLELLGLVGEIAVYDDFAHHPTAIATTLQGLRARADGGRVLALIEPRSNTMRMGRHRNELAASTAAADVAYWYQPEGIDWSLEEVVRDSPITASIHASVEDMVARVVAEAQPGDQIVIMSNGSFGGIHQRLMAELAA